MLNIIKLKCNWILFFFQTIKIRFIFLVPGPRKKSAIKSKNAGKFLRKITDFYPMYHEKTSVLIIDQFSTATFSLKLSYAIQIIYIFPKSGILGYILKIDLLRNLVIKLGKQILPVKYSMNWLTGVRRLLLRTSFRRGHFHNSHYNS
jgi:hypothetical protein